MSEGLFKIQKRGQRIAKEGRRGWRVWRKKNYSFDLIKPMKMMHYIKRRNFKHFFFGGGGGFGVQRKRDNAFNAGINMEMNLA